MTAQRASDGGPAQADASAARDLGAPADTTQATDGIRCAVQKVDPLLIPVLGTVRGPKVEGEVCDNGLGTFFLGPQETVPSYVQDFYTTTSLGAPYSPTGYDRSLVYGFLIRTPADAESAVLAGYVGATTAKVGTYDSTTNCGYLDFLVTLAVPPDVVCTSQFLPCDPGCTGSGELSICAPAHPRLRYAARPSARCGTGQEPALGSWVLTLTSVSPYIPRDGYLHHETHGTLTATLVNREDPSDNVVLNLEF